MKDGDAYNANMSILLDFGAWQTPFSLNVSDPNTRTPAKMAKNLKRLGWIAKSSDTWMKGNESLYVNALGFAVLEGEWDSIPGILMAARKIWSPRGQFAKRMMVQEIESGNWSGAVALHLAEMGVKRLDEWVGEIPFGGRPNDSLRLLDRCRRVAILYPPENEHAYSLLEEKMEDRCVLLIQSGEDESRANVFGAAVEVFGDVAIPVGTFFLGASDTLGDCLFWIGCTCVAVALLIKVICIWIRRTDTGQIIPRREHVKRSTDDDATSDFPQTVARNAA